MIRPGPRNLITDVDGIRVGNANSVVARSGVTVVLPDRAVTAAVDVRGGAPGTHETDALHPVGLVERVDAVVLTGGSAFGLEAAAGTMSWLAQRGRGFAVAGRCVPIVPAAVLFDLANGGDKEWGASPPYRGLAAAACDGADVVFALGNAGAGLGAKAGDLKGGLGSASVVDGAGLQVGSLIAANPAGSVVMPGQDTLWAWAWEIDGEMGGQTAPAGPVPPDSGLPTSLAQAGGNTTIGVVATNGDLTRTEALRVAIMAQDGMARAIRPSHTPFDGDTLFVLATGSHPLGGTDRALAVARIGALAADCVARAIGRAVWHAESLGQRLSYRDRHRPM